jgi:hypothetical protein
MLPTERGNGQYISSKQILGGKCRKKQKTCEAALHIPSDWLRAFELRWNATALRSHHGLPSIIQMALTAKHFLQWMPRLLPDH